MSALSDLERRCLRALLAERRAWARYVEDVAAYQSWFRAQGLLNDLGDELLAASRKRGRGGRG